MTGPFLAKNQRTTSLTYFVLKNRRQNTLLHRENQATLTSVLNEGGHINRGESTILGKIWGQFLYNDRVYV